MVDENYLNVENPRPNGVLQNVVQQQPQRYWLVGKVERARFPEHNNQLLPMRSQLI